MHLHGVHQLGEDFERHFGFKLLCVAVAYHGKTLLAQVIALPPMLLINIYGNPINERLNICTI